MYIYIYIFVNKEGTFQALCDIFAHMLLLPFLFVVALEGTCLHAPAVPQARVLAAQCCHAAA